MAVDTAELFVACEGGEVVLGDLFLKHTDLTGKDMVQLPGKFDATALVADPMRAGKAGSIIAAGIPGGVAAISTHFRALAGCVRARS